MSSNVFANGREISAKKDGNTIIAAMPDVCLSPPSPPAGPVPIPYPNFSEDTDTSSGTRTVLIKGKEAGQKNKSNFKKSRGDEAATRTLGMGVVTHTIQGKTKHTAWSFDVKFEGKNVTRHLDIATINHINTGNSAGFGPKAGNMKPPSGEPDCVELETLAQKAIDEDGPEKDKLLAKGEALVTSKHSGTSSSRFFKAIQPGNDWVNTGKNSAYSQPHGKDTQTCTDTPYNPNRRGNKGHSECKIMEHLFGDTPNPGGSLTMRINWNNGGNLSDEPCGQCMGTICKTAQQCGIKISICTGDADKLEKKDAPCKTVNHRPGTKAYKENGPQSHEWDSSLWIK